MVYIVMVYIVMVYIVMARIVMACIHEGVDCVVITRYQVPAQKQTVNNCRG